MTLKNPTKIIKIQRKVTNGLSQFEWNFWQNSQCELFIVTYIPQTLCFESLEFMKIPQQNKCV